MKSIAIILLTFFMNGCGSSKQVANSLTDNTTTAVNAKTQQSHLTFKYTTSTRGSYTSITVTEQKCTYKSNRNEKPTEIALETKDWNELMTYMSDMSLDDITSLEAQSKAHQYDGAAGANFSVITKDGKTYNAPTYDAGNPHKKIAPIVEKMKALIAAKK